MSLREEARAWLEESLSGEFAGARGLGGPGREHEAYELRRAWERHLGAHGWTCLGWPRRYGGRAASIGDQVAFHEEYARAGAPARLGLIGEGLIGPTILDFGTAEQKDRFLPPIQRGDELWCQGYSEPEAGSDLAGVRTRARLEGGEWVITGQKVWTSLAQWADWCFALCRTEEGSQRHRGLSYLLVPMRQPGVEVRPIVQLTGTSEFNEVFFDGARTAAGNILGAPGDGWRVAMATLGYERGVSTLGQQIGFRRELAEVIAAARRTGAIDDPVLRDRLVRSWLELEIMRLNALRVLRPDPGPEASITKLYWSEWHRRLGELAQAVQGRAGLVAGDDGTLGELQRLYLFSRADTIYAGSSEIQRTVIAERTLGLPR
ncbi:putative acyl-CoA dehydrogenase [[Actinomadura] parvosata subsp. kistnae]|uniref:Acyl-CoA dehydrogenase n=1 Tax=[Actinomadura] parvosata subsp. kistnae TaxID=1909395 RepID=A0A1V0A6M8_9ACTN|nr:acyl-CoA dehydrogenase family protein [Nonomuraea sp. ATCC 55076]AQZ65858.1 acyl-CoA dehydrogenase [Nonomuraea sp. ATCC 55076]SPL97296.1 putative acyl-CoA dehydrogenase [Actinomadura parvosata subsp. kistnae]